jgi:hypothetical protein
MSPSVENETGDQENQEIRSFFFLEWVFWSPCLLTSC